MLFVLEDEKQINMMNLPEKIFVIHFRKLHIYQSIQFFYLHLYIYKNKENSCFLNL